MAGANFSYEITHEVCPHFISEALTCMQLMHMRILLVCKRSSSSLISLVISFRVLHLQCRSLLYLMIGGRIGVLTWKL